MNSHITTRSLEILIIDDEPENLRLLMNILKNQVTPSVRRGTVRLV